MLALRKEFIGKGGWKYVIQLSYYTDAKMYRFNLYKEDISGSLWLHASFGMYYTIEETITEMLDIEHYYRTGFHSLKEPTNATRNAA